MASIRKLASGKYLYRWRADGKQPSKTFDRRIDAERFARQIEAAKDRGDYVDPEGARITISEWVNEWHQGRLNLRPSTEARDRIYINQYIVEHLGDKQLRNLTPQVIRHWVASLNETYAPATTRKAFQLLSASLNQAVTDRIILTNPAAGTALPQNTTPIHRYLELQEIHHLAATIEPPYSALVYVGCLIGLRPGELAALRLSNLDLNSQRLTVTHTATEVAGHLTIGPPKTKASLRTIAIGNQLTDIIGRHLDAYGPGDNISYIHIPLVPDIPQNDETRTPQSIGNPDPRDAANTPMSLMSPPVFSSPEGGLLRLGTFRQRKWKPAVHGSVGEPMRIHDAP